MNTLEVVIAENDGFIVAVIALGLWGMRVLAAKGSFGQSQARARKGGQSPETPPVVKDAPGAEAAER